MGKSGTPQPWPGPAASHGTAMLPAALMDTLAPPGDAASEGGVQGAPALGYTVIA